MDQAGRTATVYEEARVYSPYLPTWIARATILAIAVWSIDIHRGLRRAMLQCDLFLIWEPVIGGEGTQMFYLSFYGGWC